MSVREIARKWGVGHTTVIEIREGRIRKDISSQYDMSGLSDEEKLRRQTGERVVDYVTKKGEPTNVLVSNLGRFFRAGSLTELHPSMQHKDPCVVIRITDGPKRTIPCKKIVAEMFCDNPYGFKDIINIDGNLFNLKSTNLKYVPHSVLCQQMMDTNVRRSYNGDGNPNAKVTEADVYTILHMYYDEHVKPKKIAKIMDMTKKAIENICDGESWAKQYSKFMSEKYKSGQKYSSGLKIKLGV